MLWPTSVAHIVTVFPSKVHTNHAYSVLFISHNIQFIVPTLWSLDSYTHTQRILLCLYWPDHWIAFFFLPTLKYPKWRKSALQLEVCRSLTPPPWITFLLIITELLFQLFFCLFCSRWMLVLFSVLYFIFFEEEIFFFF